MKKIIDLRRINKSAIFIFYNAKQLEFDYRKLRKNYRGVARILSAKIINNMNKVMLFDSRDIFVQKDLS